MVFVLVGLFCPGLELGTLEIFPPSNLQKRNLLYAGGRRIGPELVQVKSGVPAGRGGILHAVFQV